MSPSANPLLTDLLASVSRSFYLTLRVLPRRIRRPIGLAYLLARATDTIADTDAVPLEERLRLLAALRARITGANPTPLDLTEYLSEQSVPEERTLLARINEALTLLQEGPEADRAEIRRVLETITSGQELDLTRFAQGSAQRVIALDTGQDLDDYTYRVAGCVGEFWTRMCRGHVFPGAAMDDALLLERAVRFGKGLQLVNILRDLPRDLERGRCYLPAAGLAAHNLAPTDLLDARTMPRFVMLFGEYLDCAGAHLAAGWNYTNMLPRSQVRVRLACAWPILIGLRTIRRLRLANVLDPSRRVKIPRAEVRSVMLQTLLRYPFPGAWQRLFEQARS